MRKLQTIYSKCLNIFRLPFLPTKYCCLGKFFTKADHYCATTGSPRAHEFCRCYGENGGDEGRLCKNACIHEINCKGYDFSANGQFCRIFTTAKCTSECNTDEKQDKGATDDLQFKENINNFTCAIKNDSKLFEYSSIPKLPNLIRSSNACKNNAINKCFILYTYYYLVVEAVAIE